MRHFKVWQLSEFGCLVTSAKAVNDEDGIECDIARVASAANANKSKLKQRMYVHQSQSYVTERQD